MPPVTILESRLLYKTIFAYSTAWLVSFSSTIPLKFPSEGIFPGCCAKPRLKRKIPAIKKNQLHIIYY